MLSQTSPTAEVKFVGTGPAVWRSVLDILDTWRWRARTRRQLAQIDANGLKDIGLSALDRRMECEKPFWRG
jgi:uncharacterized protein YjiS (DUF1127 family)